MNYQTKNKYLELANEAFRIRKKARHRKCVNLLENDQSTFRAQEALLAKR
jgi:hypothetical protein